MTAPAGTTTTRRDAGSAGALARKSARGFAAAQCGKALPYRLTYPNSYFDEA